MVVGWIFVGSGYHATIKGSWLIYKLYYDITAAFLYPDLRYYFFLVSDIVRVGHITSYLARNFLPVLHIFIMVLVGNIICIGHITSYLDFNVCLILHIYSSSVSDWFKLCYRFLSD